MQFLASVPPQLLTCLFIALVGIVLLAIQRVVSGPMRAGLNKMTGNLQMEATVDHPKEPYYPGDVVHATVMVSGDKETKVSEGNLALVREEQYDHEETYRDSNDETQTRKVTSTDAREVETFTFMQAATIAPGAPQTFTRDFAIPAGAEPTYIGDSVKMKWYVRGTLKRSMAPDTHAEVELGVVSLPTNKSAAGEFGKASNPDTAAMSLQLPREEWKIGERIEGKLLVNAKSNFDVKKITLTLRREESVRGGGGGTTIIDAAGEQLAPATKFSAGQAAEFPFSIMLPTTYTPTLDGAHGEVKWILRGAMDRGMLHGDYKVEEELYVYSGEPKSA